MGSVCDIAHCASGSVEARLSGHGSRDGEGFVRNHNAVTEDARDVMAEAYGGDSSRVPKFMGFVYGASQSGAPALGSGTVWQDLEALPSGFAVQVVTLSRPPYVVPHDGESPTKVVFSGVTRSGESGFKAGSRVFGDTDYVSHAVLLGAGKCGSPQPYTVLAVAVLGKTKPSEYEIALDWSVSFK